MAVVALLLLVAILALLSRPANPGSGQVVAFDPPEPAADWDPPSAAFILEPPLRHSLIVLDARAPEVTPHQIDEQHPPEDIDD